MLFEKNKNIKLLSLFDGIGCFPLALANILNIKPEDFKYTSSEIEPYLIDIINKNFPKVKQLGDIEKVNYDSLSADIVTMGTPCTGFSVSGKQDGLKNVESRLFSDGVNVINKVRPKYFIWENVYGVLSNNKGKEFRSVLDAFRDIGYDVVWTTYDTKYFGLPQRRRRIYMIGIKNGINENHNIFSFLERSKEKLKNKAKKIDKYYENYYFESEDLYYFNRQRSDLFKAEGIASTLAKRDYKSFKDLFVYDNIIKRESPKERLRLQGMPDNWFSNLPKKYSDSILYRANGMSLPVVEEIFREIINYDKEVPESKNKKELLSQEKNKMVKGETAFDIKNKKGLPEGRIAYSGHMRKLSNNNYEYMLIDSCSESPVKDFYQISLEDIVDKESGYKYKLSERSIDGILRREAENNKPLPKILREKIKEIYKK
tara:strand:+ start:1891 stop:3177 length:1287 start_codon:yes stop_codon:yes gene_type:complete